MVKQRTRITLTLLKKDTVTLLSISVIKTCSWYRNIQLEQWNTRQSPDTHTPHGNLILSEIALQVSGNWMDH